MNKWEDEFKPEDEEGAAGLLSCTFEGFVEQLQWHHPSALEWNDYMLNEQSFDRLLLLDDFPLELLIPKKLLKKYTQVGNKTRRTFHAALSSLEPAERSHVYSAFSTCCDHRKWGKQDPQPGGKFVITKALAGTACNWRWLPRSRVLEFSEEEVVEQPEHELVDLIKSGLYESICFQKDNPAPVPLLAGAALDLAGPL